MAFIFEKNYHGKICTAGIGRGPRIEEAAERSVRWLDRCLAGIDLKCHVNHNSMQSRLELFLGLHSGSRMRNVITHSDIA